MTKNFYRVGGLFASVAAGVLTIPVLGDEKVAEDFRVHEWGTFTTLYDPNGSSLAWYQDASRGVSELPSFVYDPDKALRDIGLSRKTGTFTARMETPVLYFYTDEKMTVDVEATYKGGRIIEVFPGHWQQLELIPPAADGELTAQLPIDPELPDNHYYEARAVPDAAFVRQTVSPKRGVIARSSTEASAVEVEKFLFYRGAGIFDTKLRPELSESGNLTVRHHNKDFGIEHVWALASSDNAVRWTKLPPFVALEKLPHPVDISLAGMADHGSKAQSVEALVESMIAALVEEGLTQDEAAAMIATWDEQWFEEPGQRIFSIPPQKAIDDVLPLTISPRPSEIVRVFVHRQEILSRQTLDALESSLSPDLSLEQRREEIAAANLGRFVHGAVTTVAREVGNRTHAGYLSRGLEAIASMEPKKPQETVVADN